MSSLAKPCCAISFEKEPCLCKSLEKTFFITHMKIAYKGNLAVWSLLRCFMQVDRSPESCETRANCSGAFAHLSEHICPFTPLFLFMIIFQHLVCVPVWHSAVNMCEWKRLYSLKMLLDSNSGIKITRGQSWGGKKSKKSTSTQSEWSSWEQQHGCSVSSGHACLCLCVLNVCVNLCVWAAGVEASFKTDSVCV